MIGCMHVSDEHVQFQRRNEYIIFRNGRKPINSIQFNQLHFGLFLHRLKCVNPNSLYERTTFSVYYTKINKTKLFSS